MRLYLASTFLALKQTGKAAALPLAALLLCLLFAASLLQNTPNQPPEKPMVGVLCLDTDPLITLLAQPLLDSPELAELAQLRLLETGESTQGLAAVITLPHGFINSLMTGENLSPTVQLNSQSGLAGVYVGALCTAVERYLSSAQWGIRATAETVGELPPQQQTELLAAVNLRYMTLFLNRLSILTKQYKTFDGFYLLRCASAVLLLLLGGITGGAIGGLKTTARAMARLPGRTALLFGGGVTASFLCGLFAALVGLAAAFGAEVLGHLPELLVLAVLTASVGVCFFAFFRNSGTAALALCGFTLITALLSGLMVPLELLPRSVAAFAPVWPAYHAHALVAAASGGVPMTSLWGALMVALGWLVLGAAAWGREVQP